MLYYHVLPVADPGFPVGGGGAPTSDVGTFWQKCMRKRKNWILLGGAHADGPPMDPPMITYSERKLIWHL